MLSRCICSCRDHPNGHELSHEGPHPDSCIFDSNGRGHDTDKNQNNTDSFSTNNCHTTTVTKMQIILNDLMNKLKASLKLHDDIVEVINRYVSYPNFNKHTRLKCRKLFIASMEKTFKTLRTQQ